jgi:uncharacterized protein (TIGR02453 family)
VSESHITPRLFDFLRELKQDNTREWFQANRERYERDVRGPLLQFIADFGPRLEQISRHMLADPRPVGGSLFRIHRDTRFAKDKSPYKTWAACQFRHERGKDVHAPGFYLHVEPGTSYAGCGLWHPEPETLRKIRDAIVDDPVEWEETISGPSFQAAWERGGDVLKRTPTGYDPNHPFAADLKRKDHIASVRFTEADVCAPDFIDRYAAACRAATPYMTFLTRAVGLSF